MINLKRLETFVCAAENLNFHKAAELLHLSQPTVSHHIKALERDFGVDLFDRSGATIKLTEAGHLLLPWARRLIHQAIEMQQIMGSLQQEIAGHIRIACSTTTGKYVLPQLASRFHQQHPGVRISIMRCTPGHVVPHLLEAEANLGVVSYDVCGDEVTCQEYFEDHIVLIASAGHPWASREFIEPSELVDEPFIIREPSSGTRRVVLAELGKHDISLDDMKLFLELGNAEAIVKTVEAGYGVSFVSRLATAWALDLGTVVEVPLAGVDLRRKIFMVRNHIHEANRAVEAFWGFAHDPANMDLLRLAER
jgi:DNA-binding transcriptional LysR family regulator